MVHVSGFIPDTLLPNCSWTRINKQWKEEEKEKDDFRVVMDFLNLKIHELKLYGLKIN